MNDNKEKTVELTDDELDQVTGGVEYKSLKTAGMIAPLKGAGVVLGTPLKGTRKGKIAEK